MKIRELDAAMHDEFLESIRSARKFATESKDTEALGRLAQLLGTCIDWGTEKNLQVGFNTERDDDE